MASTAAALLAAIALVPENGGAQRTRVPAGTLTGVVRDDEGAPVDAAQLRINSVTSLSGADGSFTIAYPVGYAFTLRVQRIGFAPAEIDIGPAGPPIPLEVRMSRVASALEEVVVEADSVATSTHLREFERRRQSGWGRYITASDVEERRPANTVDLFRTIPGANVDTRGMSRAVIRFRGMDCDPLVWIDGNMMAAGFFEPSSINPSDVAGIEIYRGLATTPPELRGPGSKGLCGVIAIWTKRIAETRRPKRAGAGATADDVERVRDMFHVYTREEVDTPASFVPGREMRPTYPDSLLRAGIGGSVVVELVVDSAGLPEITSANVVRSTHPALSSAVLEAVPRLRFHPAWRKGRRVRQLVQLPVVFQTRQSAEVTPAPSGLPKQP